MLQGLYQLKVTLTDVEYDMREMHLCSVRGNYLWNAATVSKPVCACTCRSVRVHTLESKCACVRVWYACPCIIRRAYMAHSAGGIGHENSLQKLLQQTETSSRIWASARWTVSSFSLRNLWNQHFDSLNVIFLIEFDYHTAVDQERNILFVLVMAASCHCLFAL